MVRPFNVCEMVFMNELMENWKPLLLSTIVLIGAITLSLIAHYYLSRILKGITRKTKNEMDNFFIKHGIGPLRIILILLSVNLVLPFIKIPSSLSDFLQQAFNLCWIALIAWIIIKAVFVFEELILSRYDIDARDNLEARKVYTQVRVIKRIFFIIIGILALSVILMTFEKFRQLGTSILASAGIIGIIVGFAAQRSIATVFAGLQIAITQPIRLDDVVIVEKEWGWIEEITLTYVVVRIWDLRRLVLPITYFIEKPFQNWTRISADILGTVYIYVDYTVPVQSVREELHRILKGSELWDGKVWGMQVTNATEHTTELRALMSAADSSKAWDLRCHVREKLIEFVQKNYPEGLPKVRAEFPEMNKNEVPIQQSSLSESTQNPVE